MVTHLPMMQNSAYFTMAAMATIASAVVLEADLRRRRTRNDSIVLIFCMFPILIVWASAVLRNLAALIVVMTLVALVVSSVQARKMSLRRLIYLDLFSPAAIFAIGISSGQILITGGLDLGLVQICGCFVIGLYLWIEGRKAHQWQRPGGVVFGEFLVLSSVLIVVVKVALRKPISPDSDLAIALLLLVSGTGIVFVTLRTYMRTREEHRILDRADSAELLTQPEYASPSRAGPCTTRCRRKSRYSIF